MTFSELFHVILRIFQGRLWISILYEISPIHKIIYKDRNFLILKEFVLALQSIELIYERKNKKIACISESAICVINFPIYRLV